MILAVLAASTRQIEQKDVEDGDFMLDSFKQHRTPSSKTRREPAKVRRLKARLEIRRRVGEGQRPAQICKEMGLAQRTFYRYQAQVYAADTKMLKAMDRSMLPLEIAVLRDRLLSTYQRCLKIAEDESIPVADRLKSEQALCQVAIILARLSIVGPLAVRQFVDVLQELTED